MRACDAIPCRVRDMADFVMMRAQRIAEALEGICSVSCIIVDWDNYRRKKNDNSRRFEISYEGEPAARIMDKSNNGLLVILEMWGTTRVAAYVLVKWQ